MHCTYTMKYVTMLYTMYGFYVVYGLFCDQYIAQKSVQLLCKLWITAGAYHLAEWWRFHSKEVQGISNN